MADQTVQASWGLDRLELDPDDPWEAALEGRPIDLSGEEGTLSDRLAELAAREARLWKHGVRCALKEREDTCCHACPVSKVNDSECALSRLCLIGREQERVVMRLAVLRHGEPDAG